MLISKALPRLTGSSPSYRSAASTIPSAASSTYRNSRVGEPSPQTAISSSPRRFASTHFLMRAGITWLLASSKLSPGPYRFTGIRKMLLKPYCSR
jgi:hypothetical protein